MLVLFEGNGHVAWLSYFQRMGVLMIQNSLKSVIESYASKYNLLLKKGCDILVVNPRLLYPYQKNRKKILSLIDSMIPVIMPLRDPIGRLKTMVNHGTYKYPDNIEKIYNIDRERDVVLSVDRIAYMCGKGGFCDKPNLIALWHNGLNWDFFRVVNELQNAQIIHYFDMQEIVGERTFDTMVRLSKELGLPMPKEEDRWFYESKINNQFRYLLPITFKVDDILILIQQTLSVPKDKIDITSILGLDLCGLKIGFFIEPSLKSMLLSNPKLDFIKSKLQQYIFALKEKTQIVESNKVTEQQILEYLKEHKDLRIKFKKIVDEHLEFIKSHRPDIVQSWKYYQEFERMCEEMDKEL